MEEGPTDDSDKETGWWTPPEYRTESDGDTPSDMEDAENREVDDESADEFSDGTDEEEGDGIRDMSQLGAGAIGVKFQTVHQQSYQLVGKDTKSLAQQILGRCQQPQGEVSAAPQQQHQLQPASGGDANERTGQGHLSTSTTYVAPETTSLQVPGTAALTPASTSTTCVASETGSPQVPGTAALTAESTSSLLPRIPGPLVSQIQSSGLPEVPMTGDSPAATLCNFIKVEQHFGDVTVKGCKNLNIGGTQNIGTTPTNQEEEETPLTAAQKIRKRTTSRIQSWTKDMVETDALKKVKEKLDRGATWVTIKGRPGEGKSTIAYMALKDQYRQGRQVYQVVSPEEFNEVIMACANPVIMLDDIFGDLEFDASEWTKWRPSLRPIVDVKQPDKYVEKDSLDISTQTRKVSERTKVDQTQVKRTSPNKDKTIIIVVGRDYVLKSSSADLGMMADYIFSPQYVVEVSSGRDSYERRKIWRAHAETKNINFEESVVSEICKADCPHGFAHVCKMFVAAYEKDWTQFPPEAFFQAPIAFLNKTLNKLLKDKIKRSLLTAMIKRDGKISRQEMEEDDSLGYECVAAADDLVGSYLKKEVGAYEFDHPSIYDCVSFILSTKQSKFVIENCSLSFIKQRLRLAQPRERDENVAGETDVVANIPWTYAGHLARRFASEIHRSNLLHVLSHQAFCNSDFVDLLMDCLKTHCRMSVTDLVKLTDNSSKLSFCELLSSNKSQHLIKFIVEKENISFSENERRDIILGVCTNAACSVLKYISGRMELEVNVTYGQKKQTPLMLAAETKDSVFVDQILSLQPDLNAKDTTCKSVFFYLCANGLTSAVEHAINMGVEVNQHHGPYTRHPLYHAIANGHLEVVKLLVTRNCDIDNQKGLWYAVWCLNANMVQYLLDRGGVVDGRVVCQACEVGNINIVEMLFENGATVDMVSPDGETPFLSYCGGNPTIVSYLLKKGASVNQVSKCTGNTPLHEAAWIGSTECVDVLLKAGADVNVQNNTGDTPLHSAGAAFRVSTECVDVLLKAGANVNVRNNTGDTPLHKAAEWGYTESVDVLLKAGADVNVQNNTGDTPLYKAVYAENVNVILKAEADVNVKNDAGDTPLYIATTRESTECVDVLLKAGADVNVKKYSGDTPLLIAAAAAARRGSTVLVDMLLKAGAHVNVRDRDSDTPLLKAAALWGSTELVGVLLKTRADVNVRDISGETPLHKAAMCGSTERVDMLLKAGADVNVQNFTGDTPLHRAAVREYTQWCDAFLKSGCDINVLNDTGDTPLHTKAEESSTECVEVLLKAGPDVNVQNRTGDTPLHDATRLGSTKCVDVLLKAGADANVQNNTGDTPLHEAAGRGFTECVDMLLKAGADANVQNNTGHTPLH